MNDFGIDNYARSLYSRIGEAILLPHKLINSGEWEAKQRMCHHNVSELHLFDCRYIPVRGWFYFDLPGLGVVKFVAHSAIRTPEGEIIDITPSDTHNDYPFLDGNLSEEQYEHVVENLGFGEINFSTNNI